MSESRLLDTSIQDPILRGHFYLIIKEYLNKPNNTDLISYTFKPDEKFRPDLASYRCFNTVSLEWLVLLVCDVIDPAEPLPVGETIKLPPPAWIRSSMRSFLDEQGL